jgi:uncharacterized membrane protein (Fun14 family)
MSPKNLCTTQLMVNFIRSLECKEKWMINLTINESFAPVIFQLCIGGIGGFLIGYAIRKFVKIALIIGVLVFSLIFLAYTNVINVDYGGLAEIASSFVSAINPALDVFTPLLAHIPFIVSLLIGIFLGFTRD